jgi:hypothetical protein
VVAVLIAVCLVVILGMAAISIDGGTLLAERQRAQAAADAAASAAAADMYYNHLIYGGVDVTGTAKASAFSTAVANGFNNDGDTNVVKVHIPPIAGDYVGKKGYAEVEVQYNFQRGFSNIFSRGSIPVRGRAVARGGTSSFEAGIICLDPTLKGALNSHGNGRVVVTNSAVIDNSNHPDAAAIAGGGGSLTAPMFRITGDYTTTGSGTFIGEIRTHVPPTPDPLANIPQPDPSTMTLQSNKKIGLTSGTTYLEPGVYRGGIQMSSSASIVMAPGIYYLDGGGFQFTGGGSLTAEGVLFYNAPRNSSDAITINGSGPIRLSPMQSGIYQGITVFVDRTANVPVNVQGNGSDSIISGTFYDAGGMISLAGSGGVTNMNSQFICRAMEISGNGDINITWNPQILAQIRVLSLVE